MEYIRLYRRFYRIEVTSSSDLYNLINPEIVSVKSYLKDTSTLIEEVSTVVQESTGVYYADLNLDLYSINNSYDLIWKVKYILGSPDKDLKTSFKVNYSDNSQTIYIQNLETEVISQPIAIEIIDQPIETEIIDQPIITEIIDGSMRFIISEIDNVIKLSDFLGFNFYKKRIPS